MLRANPTPVARTMMCPALKQAPWVMLLLFACTNCSAARLPSFKSMSQLLLHPWSHEPAEGTTQAPLQHGWVVYDGSKLTVSLDQPGSNSGKLHQGSYGSSAASDLHYQLNCPICMQLQLCLACVLAVACYSCHVPADHPSRTLCLRFPYMQECCCQPMPTTPTPADMPVDLVSCGFRLTPRPATASRCRLLAWWRAT